MKTRFNYEETLRHIVNTYKNRLVVNLDAITYAANPYNVTDIEKSENYKLAYGNANDENQEWARKVKNGDYQKWIDAYYNKKSEAKPRISL